MQLFKQDDFSKGLDAEFNRLKTIQGAYPLLVNGRTRGGVITPIHRHKKLIGLPVGSIQELTVVGDLLVAIVSGRFYYKNLALDDPWTVIPGGAVLDANVSEVYSKLLTVTSNFFNRTGDPDAAVNVFNPVIASSPQALYVSDGINQAKLFSATGTYVTAGTYNTWSIDAPDYIPVGILPTVSGQKLFLVSPDRKAIYQSVSGRMTDFMINLDTDGNKGGPANTMQVAVDFNDVTNMLPTQDGGLIVSTLYATYLVFPDTNAQLFGEYVLRSQLAFPVGCVNQRSVVDLVGDTAFITQSGIQSFNVASQTKRESNNYPLGAKIQRYLANPQIDTAAVNFDDYALFSMNTVFGRAVIVYDTIREQFVSLDTGFGTVKKFAVYRANGKVRLFFSNTDNEIFEAYADTEYAVSRILLGDFCSADAAKQHAVDSIYLAFTNIRGTVPVDVEVYADNQLVQSTTSELASDSIVPAAPTSVPFVPVSDTAVLDLQLGRKLLSYKTSTLVSWLGGAELVNITMEGDQQDSEMPSIYTPASKTVPDKLIMFGRTKLGTVSTASGMAKIMGMTPGQHYVVTGTAHDGGTLRTNEVFVMPGNTVYLNGTIANCESLYQLREAMYNESATGYIGLGDVNNPDGSATDYNRLILVLNPLTFGDGAVGNTEFFTAEGQGWFNHIERYYSILYDNVELFILDTVTADVVTNQLVWLQNKLAASTATFKIVIANDPPYTDSSLHYPGRTDLQLPYGTYGADLVISANSKVYERFYINGFPYIVAGTGGQTPDTFALSANRSVARVSGTTGYLRVEATKFKLNVSFVSVGGVIIDSTTIYPR